MPGVATVVTYNGIPLVAVKTNRFARQVISSADNQDYLYTEFLFDWTLLVARKLNAFNTSGESVADGSILDTAEGIFDRLSKKRKTLTVEIAGNTFVQTPISGDQADPIGGPHPVHVNVTRIDGSGAFLVHFVIRTAANMCTSTPDNFLQSLRWEMAHEVDRNGYTTRLVNGIAEFRIHKMLKEGDGDRADWEKRADSFRRELFHPPPPYFQRENIRVRQSSDGRRLLYSFVDRQHAFFVGENSPAMTIDAKYSVQTTMAVEGKQAGSFGHVLVTAEGQPRTSRWHLLRLAVQIALAKLWRNGQAPFITDASSTYDLFKRAVQFQASARFLPNAQADGWMWDFDALGMGLINDEGNLTTALNGYGSHDTPPQLWDSNSRGEYSGLLLVAALKGECDTLSRPSNEEEVASMQGGGSLGDVVMQGGGDLFGVSLGDQ